MIELPPSADLIEGVAAIAAYLGKTERRTHWLVDKKQLPAFKIGNRWHMRKSTYAAFIERLEADAQAAA